MGERMPQISSCLNPLSSLNHKAHKEYTTQRAPSLHYFVIPHSQFLTPCHPERSRMGERMPQISSCLNPLSSLNRKAHREYTKQRSPSFLSSYISIT